MNSSNINKQQVVLLAGDMFVLGLVTLVGFANHGRLNAAGLYMLTTYVPLLTGWFLIAPHLNVFDYQRAADPRQLWRPLWAMVLAAPMVGFLRAVWLQSVIDPVFILVMGAFGGLGLLIWRGLLVWMLSRSRQQYG
jgi:hypothetical protein